MAIEIVDLPIKNGDFPYKSPFSHGFPMVFPIKNGDFPPPKKSESHPQKKQVETSQICTAGGALLEVPEVPAVANFVIPLVL